LPYELTGDRQPLGRGDLGATGRSPIARHACVAPVRRMGAAAKMVPIPNPARGSG